MCSVKLNVSIECSIVTEPTEFMRVDSIFISNRVHKNNNKNKLDYCGYRLARQPMASCRLNQSRFDLTMRLREFTHLLYIVAISINS